MRWTSALTYYGLRICASGFLAGALVRRAGRGSAGALHSLRDRYPSCASQLPHLAPRRIVVLQHIVDRGKNVGEMRARERHGLNAAEIQSAIRPYQIERRFREARGLFDACRCHPAPARNEQAPTARGSEVEAVTQPQPR